MKTMACYGTFDYGPPVVSCADTDCAQAWVPLFYQPVDEIPAPGGQRGEHQHTAPMDDVAIYSAQCKAKLSIVDRKQQSTALLWKESILQIIFLFQAHNQYRATVDDGAGPMYYTAQLDGSNKKALLQISLQHKENQSQDKVCVMPVMHCLS